MKSENKAAVCPTELSLFHSLHDITSPLHIVAQAPGQHRLRTTNGMLVIPIVCCVYFLKLGKTTFFFVSRGFSTEADLQNKQNSKRDDGEILKNTHG